MGKMLNNFDFWAKSCWNICVIPRFPNTRYKTLSHFPAFVNCWNRWAHLEDPLGPDHSINYFCPCSARSGSCFDNFALSFIISSLIIFPHLSSSLSTKNPSRIAFIAYLAVLSGDLSLSQRRIFVPADASGTDLCRLRDECLQKSETAPRATCWSAGWSLSN